MACTYGPGGVGECVGGGQAISLVHKADEEQLKHNMFRQAAYGRSLSLCYGEAKNKKLFLKKVSPMQDN